MHEFIHTFSMTRFFSEQERITFKNLYGSNFFFNSDKNKFVLNKYTDDGLRVEITESSYKDRHYHDPLNRKYKAKIIITPHKLLHPGKQMGKLTSNTDIQAACVLLTNIFSEIQNESGVNLWQDAKLRRVDISKDIITPSDLYSVEIIKASKQAVHKCGYKVFKPEESKGYNPEWALEDSALFHNHSQKVAAKIYNKLHDLDETEQKEYSGLGLIRFELTLKRNRLKDPYRIDEVLLPDELTGLLCKITKDGNMLLDKYMVQTLYPGAMLSHSVLKKYLKLQNGRKEKRTKSMQEYSSWVTKMPPKLCDIGLIPAQITNRKESFKALSVSPVYVDNKCPFIPSFSDMLNGTVDQKLLNFAWIATRRKREGKKRNELIYWNFG